MREKYFVTSLEVPLPLDFFKIQSIFAHKMAEVAQIPFEQALLEGTTFYKRIGIVDWEHDPGNPLWNSLLQKIKDGEDPAVGAYKMYMTDSAKHPTTTPVECCFSYHYDEAEKTVHIHFHNNFMGAESPLASGNLARRREELANIFKEVKETYPTAGEVSGYSWLYAYEAYRSLFPPEFTANLKLVEPGLKGNGAWGQFLTHNGILNNQRADEFLQKVEKVKTYGELLNSFPLPTRETSSTIQYFYSFFGV